MESQGIELSHDDDFADNLQVDNESKSGKSQSLWSVHDGVSSDLAGQCSADHVWCSRTYANYSRCCILFAFASI